MKYLTLLFILLLSACASAIDSGFAARNQNILVETPMVTGAKCTVTDRRGFTWNVYKTPNTVTVQEGHPPLTVICKKKGYKTTTQQIGEFKEELLTIDGERVSMGIYDQFPTKAPRLVPGALKEAAGFALDPFGSVSTKYPDKISIWMEAENWESEDKMRMWAYEKEIEQNEIALKAKEDEIKDAERKAERRKKKWARKRERAKMKQEFFDSVDYYLSPSNNLERLGALLNPRPKVLWLYEKSKELKPDWDLTFEGTVVPSTVSKLSKKTFDPIKETDYESGFEETENSLKNLLNEEDGISYEHISRPPWAKH